jgi:hypothetical protein
VTHDPGCKHVGQHSDAARHCSDAVNLHVSALGWDAVKKWVAVRLSDGKSDGVLYDSKRAAIQHQYHEQQCAYVCIVPGGMNPCAAESYMRMSRMAYDAGATWIDPDAAHGGLDVIKRLTRRDQAAQVNSLIKNAR